MYSSPYVVIRYAQDGRPYIEAASVWMEIRWKSGTHSIGLILNEPGPRRDKSHLDDQVGKFGSSPAQIKNKLAALNESELIWVWIDTSLMVA
jgi:hypothetical protein